MCVFRQLGSLNVNSAERNKSLRRKTNARDAYCEQRNRLREGDNLAVDV